MRKTTGFPALAISAAVVLALSGCGSTDSGGAANEADTSDSASSAPSPTPSETDDSATESTPSPSDDDSDDSTDDSGDAIEVEIEGDKVKPNGKRIKVVAGEPVLLEIESDRDGELHVHSTPEQEIPFKKGESTLELTVDTPGVVDVEEHEAGIVLLQLEVR